MIVNALFYFCMIVVVLIVVQVFCLTSFKIPTDSMEPALFPGDYIVVDKLTKGARLFDLAGALRKEDVRIYRSPGMGKLKRNDVLVFNFPYQPYHWDSITFDVMKYYVKRCIALPGDTIEIRKGYFRIRGYRGVLGNQAAQRQIALLPDSGVPGMVMRTYPWNEKLGWTVKEFGPLAVPVRGQVIKMDSTAWVLYRQLIGWEQKCRLKIDSIGNVFLRDSIITSYRFRENYYFVSGDKAINSQDSRYWGLLPEPFIVGKAVLIWKSKDLYSRRIRWERIFKKVK